MTQTTTTRDEPPGGRRAAARPLRADAQRNVRALLEAAKAVFAASGVDAPVREIAERAGMGIGTLYRHFPTRADLIAAVFRQEIDACADAAPVLAAQLPPFEALASWLQRFVELATLKRGLAQALHSGEAAFEALPARREQRIRPAFQSLFDAALQSGDVGGAVTADEVLNAASSLCMSASDPDQAQRLVGLLVAGLRRTSAR